MKTVAAKAVIMATPKFITRRLVEGLPTKQSEAMHQIRYIPYAVVNLIFDKPVFNKGYDTWCPGNRFSDIVVADWVVRNQPGYKQKYNILTCYTPLREEERGLLLTEAGARQVAAKVLDDFQHCSRVRTSIPSRCIFTGAAILYTCPLPASSPRYNRWSGNPWTAYFLPTRIPKVRNRPSAAGLEAAERTVKEVKRRLAG